MKGKVIELNGEPGVFGIISTSRDVVDEDGVLNLPESPSGLYVQENGAYVAYNRPIPEKDYKQKRAEEYPTMGDQLDEIWKILDGIDGVASTLLDKVKAVKTKHPKP